MSGFVRLCPVVKGLWRLTVNSVNYSGLLRLVRIVKIVAREEGGRVRNRYYLVDGLVDELTARCAHWQRIASRYSLVYFYHVYLDC